MKKLYILIFVINAQIIIAQESKNYINDIINENIKVDEKVAELGLKNKIKTLKVVFKNTTNPDKILPIKDSIAGFVENYDKTGLPVSYYKYYSLEQFYDKNVIIDSTKLNYLYFNKKKLLEKHIKTQDELTELYDANGNIVETSSKFKTQKNVASTYSIKIGDSIIVRKSRDFLMDYTIKSYKYNNKNKIIEQVEYETTLDKSKLVPFSTTKFKYNPLNKVTESELILSATPDIKETINYKYNPVNKLLSVTNKLQNITVNYKYNKKNVLENITTTNATSIKIVEYKKNRIASITVTDTDKNTLKCDYTYTDDKIGNWNKAQIKMVSTDKNNLLLTTENYEIEREIEYYQ